MSSNFTDIFDTASSIALLCTYISTSIVAHNKQHSNYKTHRQQFN